jgi:hypothetical protein
MGRGCWFAKIVTAKCWDGVRMSLRKRVVLLGCNQKLGGCGLELNMLVTLMNDVRDMYMVVERDGLR